MTGSKSASWARFRNTKRVQGEASKLIERQNIGKISAQAGDKNTKNSRFHNQIALAGLA